MTTQSDQDDLAQEILEVMYGECQRGVVRDCSFDLTFARRLRAAWQEEQLSPARAWPDMMAPAESELREKMLANAWVRAEDKITELRAQLETECKANDLIAQERDAFQASMEAERKAHDATERRLEQTTANLVHEGMARKEAEKERDKWEYDAHCYAADKETAESAATQDTKRDGSASAPPAAAAATCKAVRALKVWTNEPSEFRWCSPCGVLLKDGESCIKVHAADQAENLGAA